MQSRHLRNSQKSPPSCQQGPALSLTTVPLGPALGSRNPRHLSAHLHTQLVPACLSLRWFYLAQGRGGPMHSGGPLGGGEDVKRSTSRVPSVLLEAVRLVHVVHADLLPSPRVCHTL